MNDNHKKNGIAAVMVVLIVAIVALAGGGAYLYFNLAAKQKITSATVQEIEPETPALATQNQTESQNPAPAPGLTAQNESGISNAAVAWLTYEDKILGLRFKYPAEWGAPVVEEKDLTKPENNVGNYNKGKTYSIRFGDKLTWINFPSARAITADYQEFENGKYVAPDWSDLDQLATAGVEKNAGDILYFRDKITIAGQKTTLETKVNYLPEASGIFINSSARLIGGNGEYKGIFLNGGEYEQLRRRLEKDFDGTISDGFVENVTRELMAIKNGSPTDQETVDRYKIFKQWLSTFEMVGSADSVNASNRKIFNDN